jgi:predicted nucleotidyltransferase
MLEASHYLDKHSVKILGFLSQKPLKNYYQREIARMVGVSVGKTNQVLKALESEEIVLKEVKGRMTLYRYNLHNPAARYLKIIFTLTELNELVKQLRHVSKRIVLFGSCAEGTDTAESDIDLLILTGDKEKTRKIIALTRKKLSRRVAPILLTSLELSQLKDRDRPLHEQVSRGITLWQEE